MSSLPSWAGTVPQMITAAGILSLLGTVILALFKLIPALRAQSLESKQQDIEGWREEARGLRTELKECEEECDRRLKKLEEDLWGEKRQRVAEQISLINTIVASVDAPELKTMLRTLESVQSHMMVTHETDLAADKEGGK